MAPELRAYWNSGKYARISLIEGDGENVLWKGAELFFFNKMRIPPSELRQCDIISVPRVLTARGRRSRREGCVMFTDVETRDRIATYARNLGEFIQDGKLLGMTSLLSSLECTKPQCSTALTWDSSTVEASGGTSGLTTPCTRSALTSVCPAGTITG